MSVADIEVTRVYKCYNKDCQCEIAAKQKVSDLWLKQCPFCGQDELLIESADLTMTIMFDVTKPKTIGSLAEKNTSDGIKYGSIENKKKKEIPWWRKKKGKVDFSILKNPQKYITDGVV